MLLVFKTTLSWGEACWGISEELEGDSRGGVIIVHCIYS